MACDDDADLVAIPKGSFVMGSTIDEIDTTVAEWADALIDLAYRPVFRSWLMKEYPSHKVEVGAFRVMRRPVTNGEYRRFLAANPGPPPRSVVSEMPDSHPVWGVSQAEALRYAAWRCHCDGQDWRLLTEAEWEWAASGPDGRRYPWGQQFDARRCNTVESARNATVPAGALIEGASPWGVLDMGGNVEEWTADHYAPYPCGDVVEDDLSQLHREGYPVLRGGSFALGGDLARTRRRHGPYIGERFAVTGFRLALGGTA